MGHPYNPFKADVLTFDEFPDFPANECDPYEYGKFAEQYITEQDEAKDHPLAVDLITMLTLGNPEKKTHPS